MLRKLSSELSSKRLRSFIKKANLMENMNVHQSGTMANQIYSQLAAAPKTTNQVANRFPVVQHQLPPPPAASTFRATSPLNLNI